MKQRLRRPLALLLTVVMVLGLLPTAAFAVEGEELGETVTASIPGAITLENVECEVGDEVTLDGTTTVSDGGTLSYQWYQSGDLVDDANAADEEKNDTLLEDQTGATLTVDTSVAGTFYYYVVATNTVTLEDGGTDTASTTSNVAMVTVKEAEPVTPSENSEPEDGQEPPTDSTPADDQTPGNDNANEEPGSNDLNDGEPLPPADNSGSELGEPDGEDSAPQADSTAEITSLKLINFTPHGETGSSEEELLERTSTDNAVQWDLFNPYALQVSVTVPAGNEDNTFTLTLPHGMKFVNLNTSNLEQTDGIAEAQYKKDEQIANFIPVDGESGTLTVVFESNAQQVTFSVLVQPDVAFFPLENKSKGWLISDAIQATLTCGENVQIEKTIPVDVQINADIDLDAMFFSLRIGDISDSTPDVAPGEEYRLGGNVWTGWISYNGRQNYRLRSEVVVILSVPKKLTVKQIASWWKLEKLDEDPNNSENCLWKLSAENVWNTTPSFVNQISVTVPKGAEPGTAYEINQVEIAVTTYGQEHPWTVGAPENGQPIWKLTVQNPNEVKVSFQTGNPTNVYDFTNQSTENGEPFTDYNTSFAGVKLTNDGVDNITGGLVYKAEFGQNVQFVTAVGIPCGWDDKDNTWLPTKIKIHTDANKVYTISASADGSDYSAIHEVASLAYAGKGFILRASDIDGLAPTESITSVEVELPGLPKGYASSNYFLTENGGANNAYAGVWGRVRENRGENATDENVFSLWQGSEADEALVSKTATTNIAESGKLSVATPSSEIKIKDKSGTAASANDIVHIRQSIEPNRAHGSFHDAETLLYDPVIYLFEPKDLSIENVTFSIETANGNKIENLSYTVDRISGSIENLSNAYSEVYQYTLSDKVMLGWWSSDWDAVTLYVDFDYRVAPAAKTNAYDLRDMIFYKSSLNFTMTNSGLTDQYNLNDGSTIGGVASKIFTVQAASTFNVATAIQIDGENKWYSYNPEDKANTTSVFTEGATANVKVTVTNNSGDTADTVEVYIPIPKKGQTVLGDDFISQAGFDMFVADAADTAKANGWTVEYGNVTSAAPTDTGDYTFTLSGTWNQNYTDVTDANMIKLTLSGSMANGTSAEIILKFKATNDVGQTDSMNIFKSWYKYSTKNASMVDTEKVYNFGTLLQNGKLNGTVYLDANRNGVKDEGETGVTNVVVRVTDSDNRTYETQTGSDGTYSFNSLPGNKELTVTVINPESPDPNNSGGSYRFHALNTSAGGSIGSDVTPVEDNRSASKRDFTLTDGTATVNAGLITPYKVEFKTDSQGGVVSPESTYIYANTKLSEVVKAVYVVSAGSGRTFTNQWKVGENTTIGHNDLLNQTVTADTTFTAITSTAQCVVTFQPGAGQFTGDNADNESITKNYDLNDTISTSDFPEVDHPQGNRLIGWTYNGETNTAEGWNNTPVTTDMTFTAQFAGDVTLTLIANGGQFAQGAQTTFTGAAGTEITVPTPTRAGWNFDGWYTEASGGTKITDTTKLPANNAIWYAHWTEGELTVTVTETPTYDGTPKTPSLTVKVGSITLDDGDYVAIYKNNVDAGEDTATVTVYSVVDAYAGLSGNATFSIKKAEQTVTFTKTGEQTATYGETFANTATAKLDSANVKITYSSSDERVATVDASTGEVTILKSGTVTITATAAGTSNVNEGKATYELTISKATPTLTFANSSVSVKTTGSVSNELTIKPEDLTVTYTSSNPSVATVNSSTGEITLVGEGTATITATFAEDEKYNEAKASYTLTVDNDAIAYTAEGWNGTYDGTPHGITVNVTTPADGATVTYSTTEDGNYSDQKPTYTNAGNYTVYFKIDAKGYDTVTGSANVIINKAVLTDATVTGGEYTGKPVGSVSAVKAGTLTVPEDSYDVTYVNNVDAGTAVAIITAKTDSNFVGTVPETFTITPKQLTEKMVSPIADQPYTGDQITPDVTVEDGTTPLVEGKDFTVTYGNNTEVGTGKGTVTITGTGNYTDEVEVTFNITNTGAFKVIVDNSEHTYNGNEHTPTVVVYAVDKDGVMTPLKENTDYTVTYADNINAGTASVTVTGTGAYDSWKDAKATFTIQPAEQSVAFASAEVETTYGDPTFTQAATVTLIPNVSSESHGAVTYTSGNPAVATVDSTGKVTILGAGTATITASAAATQNYKGAEASYKLTVKPKDINSEDVTASKIPDQPYGGVPVTPDFSLTDSDSDISKHDLKVNVDYTFTYSDNNGEGEGKITIAGKGNYTGIKEVTFKIIPWSDSQVVVTPAAITIYMGGADGYEGAVVDEDTGEIKASSSLPEPGFLFTLPEMLKDALAADHADLTDITFREPASGKEWTAEFYADGARTVYRLVPSGAQEPVRVQFTNAQGQTVTEDKFEVGENINQTLTMTLYKGDVGVIYAIYDGVQYPIRLGKSTLTVRGVTEEAQYAAVTDGTEAPVEGKPAVAAESGTTYTINGSKVQVEDPSGVALLYDSIIDASGEDRTGLLEDKAESAMAALNKEPANGNRFAYSFQYLDLVDTNNGNAWVKASKDVTIYWPYPAGTNKETVFTLLHFEGLHREMDTSEIGDQIANCTVREVTIANKTDTHIVLKVGSAGFSPFALVWEEKIPTYTITATSNGNGSITPAGVTTVQEGGSQSYTIKADNGYHISDVKVNGVSVGAVESYPFTNVQSNQTIAVTFSRNNSGGGGGGGHTKPSDPDEDIPDEPGSADPFDTGVGNWLNTEDHTAYLGGYGGGLFGPDDNMTRAQAAQMFYNLLLDQDVPITVSFTDVAADAWYAKAVNTLASLGIVDGIGGNHYAPERAITRAEFTVIAMRFAHLDTSGENIFSDVTADAWYYDYVVGSIQYGWINGYEDGTFRPNNTITRSEVTAIVNRMLGRSADKVFVDHHADELTQFSDVPGSYWAYYEIMEAANAHDYVKDNGVEDWTRLQ